MKSRHKVHTDFDLIMALLSDEIFISSIEESLGKIEKIYPDWKNSKIIYELKDGRKKESSINKILQKLKEINYISHISH